MNMYKASFETKITLITIIDNKTTKKIHSKIQFIIIIFLNIYRKKMKILLSPRRFYYYYYIIS